MQDNRSRRLPRLRLDLDLEVGGLRHSQEIETARLLEELQIVLSRILGPAAIGVEFLELLKRTRVQGLNEESYRLTDRRGRKGQRGRGGLGEGGGGEAEKKGGQRQARSSHASFDAVS